MSAPYWQDPALDFEYCTLNAYQGVYINLRLIAAVHCVSEREGEEEVEVYLTGSERVWMLRGPSATALIAAIDLDARTEAER